MEQSRSDRAITEAEVLRTWEWLAWAGSGLIIAIGAVVVLVGGFVYEPWVSVRIEAGIGFVFGLFVLLWGLNNAFDRDG